MLDRFIISPVLIPGKSMPRFHEEIGNYIISYSAEFIYKKWEKTQIDNVKTTNDHGGEIMPCKVIRSFIKNEHFKNQLLSELEDFSSETLENIFNRFDDLPTGTWMMVAEFDSPESLDKAIESGKTGLSGEVSYVIEVNGKKVTVLDKYKRMNKPSDHLPYEIHIYGGSTWSWGRSEHGKAHFEIKKNGQKFDKIYIPYSNEWNTSTYKEKIDLLVSEKGKVSQKERKKIVDWLNQDNTLQRCHEQWNQDNKDNLNRVEFIY